MPTARWSLKPARKESNSSSPHIKEALLSDAMKTIDGNSKYQEKLKNDARAMRAERKAMATEWDAAIAKRDATAAERDAAVSTLQELKEQTLDRMTQSDFDIHDGLDFSQHEDVQYSFGIFSVKFSSDGRELVAGSNDDSIYVYDLHANKLTLRLPAHTSDVNTVAFADETGHLIYSGSDDNLCKVWDRRCLSTGEAAGVLTGHLHGVTHIDSRGDGRSFISNGKDQAIKLWDIRKMKSNADSYADGAPTWDYRYSRYPHQLKQLKHPHDQSLATYRGHSVLRTLIRCYFSPAYSTGQKYIYTGSYDSSVYIYDVVSGSQVAKLKGHQLAIRDCSWHPFDPTLVSSSWDGRVLKWTSTREQETSDVD